MTSQRKTRMSELHSVLYRNWQFSWILLMESQETWDYNKYFLEFGIISLTSIP